MSWRPKKHVAVPTTNVATNETVTPVSQDLIDLLENKTTEIDQDSDGEGVNVSADANGSHSPASSAAASGQPTPPQASRRPTTAEVEAALINTTNECLRENPLALDFGVVKQRVEKSLGLTPGFWGTDGHDEWFLKSKNIIKMAIVSFRVIYIDASLTRLPRRKTGSSRQIILRQRMPLGCYAISPLQMNLHRP